MIVKTLSDERRMSALLGEQAAKSGGPTNINHQFIVDSLFSAHENYFPFTTNDAGEVIDLWGTPFQIKLVGPTNFIVRSAGKNRKFGDADDIIFNGISNDFVTP